MPVTPTTSATSWLPYNCTSRTCAGAARIALSRDERTIQAGLNFTPTTTLGDLDLLGEVAGGGFYEQLLPFTLEMETFGEHCASSPWRNSSS